jgi:acyl dehydratase
MPLNHDLINVPYPPIVIEATAERIAAFADAIGDPNPIYRDEQAAKAAGLPGIIAPPTFATTVQIEAIHELADDPALGLDFSRVLHGDQDFRWVSPIVAGSTLSASPRATEMRGRGGLEFLVTESDVQDQDGNDIVHLRSTLIIRGAE